MKRLTAYAAILSVLALWGCGGGGKRPPIHDVTVGGIWSGTLAISGQEPVALFAYVTEAGPAHFIREDGVQYWGTLQTSQRELSGSLSGATPLGETFPDGSTGVTGSITGTIIPYGTIRGTMSFTTSGGAAISGETFLEFDPMYGQAISVENLAGNYTDAFAPGSDSLSINTFGVVFAQIPSTSCVLNGQLKRINPPYNVYSMSVTYSDCTGEQSVLNGATVNGLGILDVDSDPLRLVMGLGGTASGVPVSILFVYERT